FFSSRRRHTRFSRDWSSDVCSSDLVEAPDWLSQGGAGKGTSIVSIYPVALGDEDGSVAAAPQAAVPTIAVTPVPVANDNRPVRPEPTVHPPVPSRAARLSDIPKAPKAPDTLLDE